MEGICPGPQVLETPEVLEGDAPELGNHGSLTFRIIENLTGRRLPDVRIRLARDTMNADWLHEGYTNQMGEMTTAPLPPGEYWAIVHYIGYRIPYTRVRTRSSWTDTVLVSAWSRPIGCALR